MRDTKRRDKGRRVRRVTLGTSKIGEYLVVGNHLPRVWAQRSGLPGGLKGSTTDGVGRDRVDCVVFL